MLGKKKNKEKDNSQQLAEKSTTEYKAQLLDSLIDKTAHGLMEWGVTKEIDGNFIMTTLVGSTRIECISSTETIFIESQLFTLEMSKRTKEDDMIKDKIENLFYTLRSTNEFYLRKNLSFMIKALG